MVKLKAATVKGRARNPRTKALGPIHAVLPAAQSSFTVQNLLLPTGQLHAGRITVRNLVDSIREGIPSSAIDVVSGYVGIPKIEVARVLHMNPRTLARRRGGVLSSEESEKVVRMGRVMERAAEVFGDMDSAAEWLKVPNRALSGQTPLSMLDTDIGSEAVMDTLGRIEHGVFA